MKKISIILLLLFMSFSLSFAAGVNFNDYFLDKTMRVDLYHTGNAKEEIYSLDKTYSESVLMPYPKNKIQFTIEKRDKYTQLHRIFDCVIDPNSTDVIKQKPPADVEVINFQVKGDNHKKVDLLFVAEGYTAKERGKFINDAERLLKVFFANAPYVKNKDNFNVRGVFRPSEESGCDESSHGSFKKTAINSGFDFFGSERYLMTDDNKAMREAAPFIIYTPQQ